MKDAFGIPLKVGNYVALIDIGLKKELGITARIHEIVIKNTSRVRLQWLDNEKITTSTYGCYELKKIGVEDLI